MEPCSWTVSKRGPLATLCPPTEVMDSMPMLAALARPEPIYVYGCITGKLLHYLKSMILLGVSCHRTR